MGIIFPKGGIPLSDRSCLNLERKDSFCYPLPAANIWGPLFVTMRQAGALGGKALSEREGRSHGSSKDIYRRQR